MRIGLLITGSLETVSGGFLYDRMLVRHLESRGDKVEVVAVPWRPYGRALLDNLSPRLLNALGQNSWDLLLQDELAHPSVFWRNPRLKEQVSYPIISLAHHLRSQEGRPAWQNRLYREVERRYLASVDGFICVSHPTRADVAALGGEARPWLVAHPGSDSLSGGVTPAEIRARAWAAGPLKIIFVGNLIPRKGLHTLVAALATLPVPDWRPPRGYSDY